LYAWIKAISPFALLFKIMAALYVVHMMIGLLPNRIDRLERRKLGKTGVLHVLDCSYQDL
jgi:hypothetical protein